MKQFLFLILLSVTFAGCSSCGSQFYGVHEPLTPHRVKVKIRKNADNLIKSTIDSLNHINPGLCSYNSVELKKNDRVVCFANPQCECYYLGVDDEKITIYAVTIPEKKDIGWLFYKEQLDSSEQRVTKRIRDFVQTIENELPLR